MDLAALAGDKNNFFALLPRVDIPAKILKRVNFSGKRSRNIRQIIPVTDKINNNGKISWV